ncbi:MAG: hypothetical protein JRF61_06350, partial [Deltaproteobacteria bacterium]|nr:hypothetical protein [Deltaproteobacteria bacterium]
AVLGISRMLPTAEPSVAQAMAGLGAVGAFAAAALALTRRDARSTLGYASASTAAVLLGGLPALLGQEAGDATAWHVVALTAPLAVPSLAAACPHRRRRDVILSSAVAVHALAGASFAHAASAAAPGWPAAGAQLAAVVATLSFALAARASRGMPQDEPISAGVATIPLLAAAGALVLTPAPDPSLVWAWGGMPMLIALLIVWRFRRPAEPEARSLHVPTGDLVALAERFGRGLARRLTPIFNERLPQRRDRVADALGAWFVDPRWAAACEQIEAGLARWTVTSVLILAAAITITWLFVP